MSRRNKNNSTEIVSDNMAVLPAHGLIVAMSGGFTPSSTTQKPKSPRPDSIMNGGGDVAYWGDNNNFPQDVIDRAKKDLGLLALIEKKARLLHGREVIAVQMKWDQEKEDFKTVRVNNPEINEFLAGRIFQRYWREGCVDFTWFHNIFPDLIKDRELKKIVYLGTHEAAWCRWQKQNEKGTIEKCYVSAKWPNADIAADDTMKHLVLDPYSYSVVEDFKKNVAVTRAVYPANFPSPGQAYYPFAPWTQYLFSEWCVLKANIPRWKTTTMNKMLSAKYILNIPVNYWSKRYEDWAKLSPSQKLEKKKETVTEINDKLTGIENAGSTILSEVGIGDDGKEIFPFKITPIDNVFKDGQYLEDSQEAVEYMLQCLDLDPTIVGKGPGRGKDAGSGSDKRVAFNILVALLQPYRDVILEPLYFIADFNGWTDEFPGLRFKVLEVELETLDKAHKTAVVTNPVTPPVN